MINYQIILNNGHIIKSSTEDKDFHNLVKGFKILKNQNDKGTINRNGFSVSVSSIAAIEITD